MSSTLRLAAVLVAGLAGVGCGDKSIFNDDITMRFEVQSPTGNPIPFTAHFTIRDNPDVDIDAVAPFLRDFEIDPCQSLPGAVTPQCQASARVRQTGSTTQSWRVCFENHDSGARACSTQAPEVLLFVQQ